MTSASYRIAFGLSLALAITACTKTSSSSSSTTPTSPTAPTTRTLSWVDVNCDATTLTSANQTTACRAIAWLSDGVAQNQTTAALWSSSNSSVASVTSGGLVTALSDGTTSITATYQNVRGSQSITVSVPLTMTHYTANVSIAPFGLIGFRVTGTINITLSRAITPAPSRVRAEWENSMVGGTTSYSSGQTQLQITVNQDTVARPNMSNSPTDYLRLIDVDRQVVLTRGVFVWN